MRRRASSGLAMGCSPSNMAGNPGNVEPRTKNGRNGIPKKHLRKVGMYSFDPKKKWRVGIKAVIASGRMARLAASAAAEPTSAGASAEGPCERDRERVVGREGGRGGRGG